MADVFDLMDKFKDMLLRDLDISFRKKSGENELNINSDSLSISVKQKKDTEDTPKVNK